MKQLIAAGLIVIGMGAGARAGEVRLDGAQIRALLPDIIAHGAASRQVFSASGATTYTNHGRDSFGMWRVQGDQYCSQWPPSGNWVCYDVLLGEGAPETIIWVDVGGGRLINTLERRD